MQRIESKDELIEAISKGEKSPLDFKIGTEHEKFVFNISDFSPVEYDSKNGIKSLLKAFQKFGWQPINENGKIIALSRDEKSGGGSITLEPAGQFELSGAMLSNVHQTYLELLEHKNQLSKLRTEMGLDFLAIGFTPDWPRDQMPIMPKQRYDIMRDYMPKKGKHGLDMMLRSCTSQVNLDFSSELDMIKKLRVSFLLQPVATALFANSPFSDGSLNGFKSYRSEVWKDTDPDRTGILSFIFEDDMGYEKYVDYALQVPMYFINRDGRYINFTGLTFNDFMNGDVSNEGNYFPTIDDWELHLTTIFPEARLKHFIEMRGADTGNINHICALSAFWVGLMYDQQSLNDALDLTKNISIEELIELRNLVPHQGLLCKVGEHEIFNLAAESVNISRDGLKRRDCKNKKNVDESVYLEYLDGIIIEKESPADKLISNFSRDWNKNITEIYQNCIF